VKAHLILLIRQEVQVETPIDRAFTPNFSPFTPFIFYLLPKLVALKEITCR
jgi:hypothetical protein